MSDGDVYIVAKPRVDANPAGVSDLSVVDVWLVPAGSGGPQAAVDSICRQTQTASANLYDLLDPSPRPAVSPLQHLTLYRTPQGWQVQSDNPQPYRDMPNGMRAYPQYPSQFQQTQFPQGDMRGVGINPQIQFDSRTGRWVTVDQRQPGYGAPASQPGYDSTPQRGYGNYREQYDPRTNQWIFVDQATRLVDPRLKFDSNTRQWVSVDRTMQFHERSRRFFNVVPPPQQRYNARPPAIPRQDYGYRPSVADTRPQTQYNPQPYQPLPQPQPRMQYPSQGVGSQMGSRARYGVDPNSARILSQRDQQNRRDIEFPWGDYPYVMDDPNLRWAPPPNSTRQFEDRVDFDPDGKKIPASVDNYLRRYGRPPRPQQPTQGSFDSALRSFGDWVRGR